MISTTSAAWHTPQGLQSIASHFDLICGTSAGGLLALGLAANIPAPELKVWLTEQPSADDQPASVYEQTFVQENGFKVTMVTYEAE